jgi:hypothetical protein
MDAGIADTINRHVAQLITAHLDQEDQALVDVGFDPWTHSPIAQTLMGENDTTDGDRAWLIGMFAARTPGVDLDSIPADADWENLFANFRAEILTRRDPQTHPVRAAEIPARDGVGSR